MDPPRDLLQDLPRAGQTLRPFGQPPLVVP